MTDTQRSKDMKLFIDGAILMAYCVAGLFFLRFWVRTHDRLFVLFATAFFILAVNRIFQVALVLRVNAGDESQMIVYGIRLVAYLIILVAIVDKNRAIGSRRSDAVYREERDTSAG
jgi:uncharacterized membrane protein YeiB